MKIEILGFGAGIYLGKTKFGNCVVPMYGYNFQGVCVATIM